MLLKYYLKKVSLLLIPSSLRIIVADHVRPLIKTTSPPPLDPIDYVFPIDALPFQSTSHTTPTMTRTLLLLVPLFWAAISSATSLSAASLYLHPAATGKGRVSEISAIEANQILAHLLDVPGETLGAGASQRDVWNWIQPSEQGKKAVENLFDDSTQRGVILFTDLSEEDAKGKAVLSLILIAILRD
jgi:hypothetical protein